MPAPVTADQFLELVGKSGLLDAQRLEAFRRGAGAAPETPRALADGMVRNGLLTGFQVERLPEGKWRNFILSGKYRILRPLGAGGMAQVYLCEHQVMRRRVAVKVLPVRPDDPVALERFRREARAVAQLHHPNIVGGHDIDRDGKVHFLVMEYIDGSNLLEIIKKRGPLDPLRASHYIRQAALGLQHAHEAGLVHRDIKPGNILLDRAGTVKILDLGLARFFHDEADDLSRKDTRGPMGTPLFMAPEQALDSHQVDIRADIYSLGATFYFLLAGHSPDRDRAAFLNMAHAPSARPRSIREIRPEVPDGLDGIIQRMMARDPGDRYQTPAEIADALAPWTGTPIPRPPAAEMPELMPPALSTSHAQAAPDAPTALSEPPSSLTPCWAHQGDVVFPCGSQVPTAPLLEVASETDAPAGTHPGVWAQTTSRQSTFAAPGDPEGERDLESARPHLAAQTRPRRQILLLAAAALLLGAVAVSFAVSKMIGTKGGTVEGDPSGPVAGGSTRLRLMVPAYFYPAGEGLRHWNRLIESPVASATVAILNPDSGPGKAADLNYARVLERARQKGVTVIGYVSTKYATRDPGAVKADVDRWVNFYPGIQGIFFDEQASLADKVPYYVALYEYVRKERGLSLVVTNPGTLCAEEYVARRAADVVCVVEVAKSFRSYRRPAWAEGYPAERFAALQCETGAPAQMKKTLREIGDNNIGYCYITDAKEPNPWDRLASYWEEEVEVVRQGR